MRITALALVVLLASTAHTAVLSTIELPPASTGDIAFGLTPQGTWLGSTFTVFSPVLGQVYEVPTSSVQEMYAMVHNPSAYTAHGPLWVSAKNGSVAWTSYYDVIAYTHNDTGLAGSHTCCAMITSDNTNIFNVPWQAVTLVRTADAMTVRIYDTPTPEPGTITLLAIGAVVASVRRAGRRQF